MKNFIVELIAFLVLTGIISSAVGTEPADKCFQELPPGCFVTKSIVIPQDQTAAIGRTLGASIKKLSNTYLIVHGKSILVNILDAKTEADSEKLYKAISNMKEHPAFCLRSGKRVIEYVGNDPDVAIKTSYELGFRKKPGQIRYRIVAQLATVDKSDYMSFNKLFNLLITTDIRNPNREASSQIVALSKRFRFGKSVTLRSGIGRSKFTYKINPSPTKIQKAENGEMTTYTFDTLPDVFGVPYVTVAATITTNESGVTPTDRKADMRLISATPFWPVDDSDIIDLAKKITAGKRTTEEKVLAILKWLTPGKNIEFDSPVTGSRWGVKKVLKQKYGHCWDFSDCFVTLCRASGISCRQVGGWLYGTDGHIWAEVLIEGKGWQQVDPTGSGKLNCGIYHIPYFTTETGEMPILYVSMPKIEVVDPKYQSLDSNL